MFFDRVTGSGCGQRFYLMMISLMVFAGCYHNKLVETKGIRRQINVNVGNDAQIPCKLDRKQCGELHNVKWYRESERVFVFSDVASISRPEGPFQERLGVIYDPNASVTFLRMKDVQVSDEAIFKCEITYMEVKENCDLVQIIHLQTLVKPNSISLYQKRKSKRLKLENETILGPFNEDTTIDLECVVEHVKPVPTIQWFNGSKLLDNSELKNDVDPKTNISTVTSALSLSISRGDLWRKYECRVQTLTSTSPVSLFANLDINVRPNKIELTGIDSHVIQGANVTLQCNVYGARPAANITWFNGSEAIGNDQIETISIIKTDGTYLTKSRLNILATRFENGHEITCEAENVVLKDRNEPPAHTTIMLEVFYPPLISIRPENVTVNESSNVLIMCNYEANPQQLLTVTWLKNNQKLSLANNAHYEGGTIENPSIIVKNVSRDDLGEYSCQLENAAGIEQSKDIAFVNVLYPPVVNLEIQPSNIAVAENNENITLVCKQIDGNPMHLDSVQWYFNGHLLKDLSCDKTIRDNYKNNNANNDGQGDGDGEEDDDGEDDTDDDDDDDKSDNHNSLLSICHIDDAGQLQLRNVREHFAGNYSCDARNYAGIGARSQPVQLIVYYPPSGITIDHEPKEVMKKSSVTLQCRVKNRGVPATDLEFVWYRGQRLMPDIRSANWTIEPVSLQTESNFTCLAKNSGGLSESATVYLDVVAPPTFITKLQPYSGALFNAKNLSLSCRVECSPECSIFWLKNNEPIDFDHTTLYYVRTIVHPPDLRTNDFESVQSILFWNITSWPNKVLNKVKDNSNYSCQSTSNSYGSGVQSSTYFSVEYPPENINVSNLAISVIENNVPEKILCWAKSYPEPNYVWKSDVAKSQGRAVDQPLSNSSKENDARHEIVSKSNALILNSVTRSSAGYYVCEASNKHGKATQRAYLNVMYKPECSIVQGEHEDSPALVCSANGNPQDINFIWKIKDANNSVIEEFEVFQKGRQSFLVLDTSIDTFRTYLCYANNSIGISLPCERDVAGTIAWWKKMDQDHLVIIIAIIVAIIVCFLVICIILVVICRRKQSMKKYKHKSLSMDERQKLFYTTQNSDLLTNKLSFSFNTYNDQQQPQQQQQRSSQLTYNKVLSFKKLKNCSDTDSRNSSFKTGPNSSNAAKENPTDDGKEYYENLPFHGLQNTYSQNNNKIAKSLTSLKNAPSTITTTTTTTKHLSYSTSTTSSTTKSTYDNSPSSSSSSSSSSLLSSPLSSASTHAIDNRYIINQYLTFPKRQKKPHQPRFESDTENRQIVRKKKRIIPGLFETTGAKSSDAPLQKSHSFRFQTAQAFFQQQDRKNKRLTVSKKSHHHHHHRHHNHNQRHSNNVRSKTYSPPISLETQQTLMTLSAATATATNPKRFVYESSNKAAIKTTTDTKGLIYHDLEMIQMNVYRSSSGSSSSRRHHQHHHHQLDRQKIAAESAALLTLNRKITEPESVMVTAAAVNNRELSINSENKNDRGAKGSDGDKNDNGDVNDDDDNGADLNRKFVLPQKIVSEYATLRFFNDIGHEIDV